MRRLSICKFRNSGQTCISANRMLVQAGVYDAFVDRFSAAVGRLKVADGFAEGVDVGPLIDEPAIEKVEAHVADALDSGAELVVGGARIEGQFFRPSVLAGVTPEMRMTREETFGPVAAIARFETEEEAIRIANATPYGLAAYFVTSDLGRIVAGGRGARVRHPRRQHGPRLDRGRTVRRRQGVRDRPRGLELRRRRLDGAEVLGGRGPGGP